jgi:hypothetical protein
MDIPLITFKESKREMESSFFMDVEMQLVKYSSLHNINLLICLLDDYAIDTEYRNNLSALYSIKFNLEEEKMKIEKVYLHPLRCANLQMNLLSENEEDFWWIARKVKHLSSKFGVNLNYLQSGSNLNQLEIIFE